MEFVEDSLSGAIGGVVDGITSLGDKIGGFFDFLLDGITDLFQWLLDGITSLLKELFVPSENLGSDLKDKIFAKFPFIEQISSIVQSFLDIGEGAKEPDFSFTWHGTTVKIVDFSLVEDYLPVVHTIIVAICWSTYFIRLYRKVPSIIGGFR